MPEPDAVRLSMGDSHIALPPGRASHFGARRYCENEDDQRRGESNAVHGFFLFSKRIVAPIARVAVRTCTLRRGTRGFLVVTMTVVLPGATAVTVIVVPPRKVVAIRRFDDVAV